MDYRNIYTTQTVEGYTIDSYLGLVTANQVAGTGFLSDFMASFSDIFGGNSGAYRGQMNNLLEDVTETIIQQTKIRGGNAIIGVKVDFDNISAKNMSMFMVSMQGTAVVLSQKGQKAQVETVDNIVSNDSLLLEYNKLQFKRLLEADKYLDEEQWNYVFSHNMTELAEPLYTSYKKDKYREYMANSLIQNNFPKFLARLKYENAVDLLYEPEDCRELILVKELHLFNAKKILEYAKLGKLDLVCKLLKADKLSYSKTDVEDMKQLALYLQNLPDVGKIEEVKGSLFSSGGSKFVCECGEKNDKDKKYCSNCGRNIKGINEEQQQVIDAYVEKTQILEKLFENNKI